jgi:site-specific recombinase XerD
MSASRKQIERPHFLPGLGRPRGLHPETNRFGVTTWYYREGHGARTPMKDARGEWMTFGTPAFCARYKSLIHGGGVAPRPVIERKDKNSIGWLIGEFRASLKWTELTAKQATLNSYNSILRHVEEKFGSEAFLDVDASTIQNAHDEIARKTPAKARRFVSVMNVLFAWAKRHGHVEINPAVGIEKVKVKSQPHLTWSKDDRAKFCAYWAAGTRERLAYALLFGTGQRRSDVVLMGPKSLSPDRAVMNLTQVKTGARVSIPMSHEWMDINAEIAAAHVVGVETFIVGRSGKPMSSDDFGKWFSNAATKAGLPDHTAHGLRRSAEVEAIYAGRSAGQLKSMFGHTLEEADKYISDLNHEKVARGLICKPSAA